MLRYHVPWKKQKKQKLHIVHAYNIYVLYIHIYVHIRELNLPFTGEEN